MCADAATLSVLGVACPHTGVGSYGEVGERAGAGVGEEPLTAFGTEVVRPGLLGAFLG